MMKTEEKHLWNLPNPATNASILERCSFCTANIKSTPTSQTASIRQCSRALSNGYFTFPKRCYKKNKKKKIKYIE